jgi:diguanylate cyclase (GGDEF)-like protein/PAS domain S-box-containing protein
MKPRFIAGLKVQIAFASAVLVLIAVGTISYRAVITASESYGWVHHTYEVLDNLNKLLAEMENVESSYRGFALTGEESRLLSYRLSIEGAAQAEKMVRDLTVDNQVQQRRLPNLERLISEKVRLGDAVIDIRRTKGLVVASDTLRNGPGREVMKELKDQIGAMQDEELRLLALRDADAKYHSNQIRVILFLGTLLGIVIAIVAGWTVHRDHRARELAEDARREGEERFGSLANNISQLAWMADEKGNIFWFNNRWFDYTGTTLEEMAGSGWRQKVHHPDYVQGVLEKIRRSFETGEIWEDTFPLRGKDGIYRMFLSRAVPIRDQQGKILRWFGTNTDISDRQAAEEELFAEKERAQVTLNSIGDAVVCADMAGNVSYLNRVAEELTGWSREEAVGRPTAEVLRILDDATKEAIPNPMELAVAQNQTLNIPLSCHLIRRDGTETPIEDSVSPIHDRQGRVTGAVIVFRDVTVARAMTQQMAYSAQHDFLTGLPNRMLLGDRVSQAIASSSRHQGMIAVLFLDLDGFKQVNDTLGHSIGDKLLQSVAGRLKDSLRTSDTVSRQGGDEFVVLLSEIEHADDAVFTAKRILQAVATPHFIDGHDLHVTTSIGISIHPEHGLDGATLIKNADTAMYHAKEHGRQGYELFKPEMNVQALEQQSIEDSLLSDG